MNSYTTTTEISQIYDNTKFNDNDDDDDDDDNDLQILKKNILLIKNLLICVVFN